MKRARSTLLLLLVAAGLGAYIYFVESKRPSPEEAASKKEKVFGVETDKIQELTIKVGDKESTSLKRESAGWRVTAPIASEADVTEVTTLLSSLSSLERQLTVDENPSDVVPFGLNPAAIEVAYKADGMSEFARLLIGRKTATGSDLYAKVADNPRVFLISGFLETTFNRGTFELRDKTALKLERGAVSSLELMVDKQPPISLAKANNAWTIKAPWQTRGDYGGVEGLVGRIAAVQMKSVVAENATDLKTYGLDTPQLQVKVGAGSSQATLLVGKADGEAFFAKDGSRGIVFTVDKALVDDLRKPADTYRPKDLFEFRTFTGERVEVTRSGVRTLFERIKGSGDNAPQTWTQTEPKLDVPESKIEDFLSKLTSLQADSFAPALPTSRQEILNIATRFGTEKKEDKVTFFRAGTDVFATRPDDVGAIKLTTTALDDALKALDEVKPGAAADAAGAAGASSTTPGSSAPTAPPAPGTQKP